MHNEQCIYCGSKHLIDIKIEPPKDQNCQIIQCQDCGVMFSELEQRFSNSCLPLEEQSRFNLRSELTTLDVAFKQVEQHKWNHALELLFQHKHLSKHKAEFLIYRSVCQTAACLQQDSILLEGKDYDHQYACGLTLTMLSHNLQTLDCILSSETEEKRLAILRRITKIIKYFGSVVIFVSKQPKKLQKFLAQRFLQQRSEALCTLADYLESLQNTANGTDYQKMAAELLHAALGEHDSGSFLIRDGSRYGITLRLPPPQKAEIKNSIQRLNSIIVKADTNYLESIKPHLLHAALSPLSIFLLSIAILAVIAGFIFLIHSNHLAISFIYHIDRCTMMFFLTPIMLVCLILNAKICIKISDTNKKRRQLYDILYQYKN